MIEALNEWRIPIPHETLLPLMAQLEPLADFFGCRTLWAAAGMATGAFEAKEISAQRATARPMIDRL